MKQLFVALALMFSVSRITSADTAGPVTAAFGSHCERLLIDKLREGHKEIQAAIYEFTKKDIAEAFIERAEHGVKVTIKMDAHEAEYKYTEELIARMEHAKIKIERIKIPAEVKMHDKFVVIDGHCVVTGSYNWTRRATEENWENLVAIDSLAVAKDYLAEWERIKSAR